MDYHKLNNLTKKGVYPIPHIDDALALLSGSKFFSAIDLASGYCQMNFYPKDQEKCALICSEGLLQPTRLPQGYEMRPTHSNL